MTTEDFIIALFMRMDDAMKGIHKHNQASLYPSEIVTLGVLFSLKGVGNRAFYRWVQRDWQLWLPKLPERTRLFRLFKTHRAWTNRFLAEPTALGVVDSYGVELLHPTREGRSAKQIGKKGYSNRRWIVGSKVCWLLNRGKTNLHRATIGHFMIERHQHSISMFHRDPSLTIHFGWAG